MMGWEVGLGGWVCGLGLGFGLNGERKGEGEVLRITDLSLTNTNTLSDVLLSIHTVGYLPS